MSHADQLRVRIFAMLVLVEATTACDGPKSPPTPTKVQAPTPTPTKVEAPTPEPRGGSTGAPDEGPEPIAKTTMDPALLDAVPPPPPPPELDRMPTCPSGLWCGVVNPPATGLGVVLGCPSTITVDVKPIDPADAGQMVRDRTNFDEAATKSKRAEGTNDACCYQWVEHCPGGRPLTDGAQSVPVDFALTTETPSDAPRGQHPGAAEAWLRDAGYEYASVASFARAAVELMAVGAPTDLVEACHRAALDETRHARLCAEIAWSLGAAREIPARVPAVAPRASNLPQLATDTFLEGCVGETIAALVARTAAARCGDPGIREALEEIAGDEERHAALAWRTIRWAVDVGGSEVATALVAAAARARPGLATTALAGDPSLAQYGRLDAPAQRIAVRDGWRSVIDPLLSALVARGAATAAGTA